MKSLAHTRICISAFIGFIQICLGAHSSDPLDRKHNDLIEESMFPSILNLYNEELYVPLNAGFEFPSIENSDPLGESEYETIPMAGQYLPENPFAEPYFTCIKIARMVEAYWTTQPMPPTDGKLPIGALSTNPYQLDPELIFLGSHYFEWVEKNFTSPIDIYCLQRVILDWQIGETPILHRAEPAKCAPTFTVPLDIMPKLWESWEKSFLTEKLTDAGGIVHERGASIIRTNDKKALVKSKIVKGGKDFIDHGKYTKPKANEIHVGSYHTHPYTNQENSIRTYGSFPSTSDLVYFLNLQNNHQNDGLNNTRFSYEIVFSPPRISAITIRNDANFEKLDKMFFKQMDTRANDLMKHFSSVYISETNVLKAAVHTLANEYKLCVYSHTYAHVLKTGPRAGEKWGDFMKKHGFDPNVNFDAAVWKATNKILPGLKGPPLGPRPLVIIPPKSFYFKNNSVSKTKINILHELTMPPPPKK